MSSSLYYTLPSYDICPTEYDKIENCNKQFAKDYDVKSFIERNKNRIIPNPNCYTKLSLLTNGVSSLCTDEQKQKKSIYNKTNVGNLFKSFQTFLNVDHRAFTKISGIYGYTALQRKSDDRKLIIFYDYHYNHFLCDKSDKDAINIDQLLVLIFKKYQKENQKLDLFLEKMPMTIKKYEKIKEHYEKQLDEHEYDKYDASIHDVGDDKSESDYLSVKYNEKSQLHIGNILQIHENCYKKFHRFHDTDIRHFFSNEYFWIFEKVKTIIDNEWETEWDKYIPKFFEKYDITEHHPKRYVHNLIKEKYFKFFSKQVFHEHDVEMRKLYEYLLNAVFFISKGFQRIGGFYSTNNKILMEIMSKYGKKVKQQKYPNLETLIEFYNKGETVKSLQWLSFFKDERNISYDSFIKKLLSEIKYRSDYFQDFIIGISDIFIEIYTIARLLNNKETDYRIDRSILFFGGVHSSHIEKYLIKHENFEIVSKQNNYVDLANYENKYDKNLDELNKIRSTLPNDIRYYQCVNIPRDFDIVGFLKK